MNPVPAPAARRRLPVMALLWALAAAPCPTTAQTNDIALADTYPPARLAEILLPRGEWRPFPPAEDRAAWERVPADARQQLIDRGDATAGQPMPALPASLYLGYAREGNRSRYEGPYFERRRRLHRLVLAECAEGRKRFLDPIADTLWALCEESSWCIPAHVGAQRAGVGLPDVGEPVVDLFAAQTASSVAWTLHLLGPELDSISPRIRRRAAEEVDHRILAAYLARDYGWMGFGTRNRAGRPNNWNPWINGNVLTAALLLETNTTRRVELVHRALRSLDSFLQPYPSDGGCDEGPSYWSRAGGSVFDNLDLLHGATAGRLDMFNHPLVREIGRFIHRVHIAGDWFVALGDCPARCQIDRGVVFGYGQRIGDPRLRALASHGATLAELVDETGGIDLGRGLRTLSELGPIVARAGDPPPLVRDAWLGSDDLQLMIARDREGSTRGFFVAAWGAHNAQSHNHNDVGNFILFADGLPVLVDPGAPTYTAMTFSNRRYEIPAMQSAWHNLPTINGVLQHAGRAAEAREVAHEATGDRAQLSMDLAAAWPASARVASWRRTVRLERGRELALEEAFQLDALAPGAVLNLVTPREPRSPSPGRLVLPPPPGSPADARAVSLHFDPAHLKAAVETLPMEDGRLREAWGPVLHRIQVSATAPRAKDTWKLGFRLDP